MATRTDKKIFETAILNKVRICIKKHKKELYTKEEICDLLDEFIEAINNE